jgi:twitching motility protein PilT
LHFFKKKHCIKRLDRAILIDMDKNDLNRLLQILAEHDGSDLHLKVGSPPRIRVNGDLRKLDEPPLRPTDTSAIAEAIMHPDTAIKFHAEHEADFAYGVSGLGRFRVNAFRQRGSVGLVFRRVRHNPQTFEELGLPDVVRQLAEEVRGLILVTGPTGSGKTTTLAAMIDHINKTRECHIITIEDPIEVLHRDELAAINQREVGFDTLSFLNALRAALREDPDVILVGEMRDYETVSTAMTAAETGHLVLSTLHTINATETINRIIDFYPMSQQQQARISLAGALKGTICQRLVPKADGTGRVPALEVMVVNGRIQQCIIDKEKTHEIQQIIQEGEFYGMLTFDQSLADLYEDGVIDLRSAMMAASNPHDLRVMLQNRGLISPTSTI